jgi:hypothetical protein
MSGKALRASVTGVTGLCDEPYGSDAVARIAGFQLVISQRCDVRLTRLSSFTPVKEPADVFDRQLRR